MTYAFKFTYETPAPSTGRGLNGYRLIQVEIASPSGPMARGWADCAPQDRFVKEVGRRVAITRALHFFPRETRKAVWSSYWASKNPSKPSKESL